MQKAKTLAKCDPRIEVLSNPVNVGPYVSRNLGVLHTRGQWLIVHDADDWAFPDRIERQVRSLQEAGAVAGTGSMIRMTAEGQITRPPSVHEGDGYLRLCYVSLMVETDYFRQELGAWDSVWVSGDAEMIARLEAIKAKNCRVERPLMLCLDHAAGLTNHEELGLVECGGLGKVREAYRRAFEGWHRVDGGKTLSIDVDARKFAIPLQNQVEKSNIALALKNIESNSFEAKSIKQVPPDLLRNQKPVICGMASIYARKLALQEAVNSILPQVDKLIIYQNDYKELFDFLRDEKIEVISALDTGVDMGDAGKFYRVEDFKDTIYFSIDDDLIYPPDYVDVMLDMLDRYDYQVVACAHGRILPAQATEYYKSKLKLYHLRQELDRACEVHVGGTGVMAFNTDYVGITFKDFRTPNMADIWMAMHARSNQLPILVVPHKAEWIRYSEKFDNESTIYSAAKKGEKKLADTVTKTNELIKGLDKSVIYTIHPITKTTKLGYIIKLSNNQFFISSHKNIVVAIPTFNRKELLERLVNQLDVAAKYFNVRIVVFDDGSVVPIKREFFSVKHLLDIEVHRTRNHGKKRYWALVNKIFDRLCDLEADYYFYLGDDLEVSPTFFIDGLRLWESIVDERKISLNLLCDSRTKCWTDFERIERNFSGYHVYQTQWLDMIILFDRTLVSHRVDEVPLSRWKKRPLMSSGVGAQLSGRFHSKGFNMYQVVESIVFHGDHESKMNREERLNNPLVSHAPPNDKATHNLTGD